MAKFNEFGINEELTLPVDIATELLRSKPEAVFGYRGKQGAINCIALVIKAFLNEIALGYATRIDISVKDKTIRLISDNRGMNITNENRIKARFFNPGFAFLLSPYSECFDENPVGERNGFLFSNCSESREPFNTDEFERTSEAMFLLNCVTKYIKVSSVINGKRYNYRTEYGKPNGFETTLTGKPKISGTMLEFEFSEDVFENIDVNAEDIIPILETAAVVYPKAVFSINTTGGSFHICYNEGIKSRLEEIAQGCTTRPSFWKQSEWVKEDGKSFSVQLKISFCISGEEKSIRECYHNGMRLRFCEYEEAIVQAAGKIIRADESLPAELRNNVEKHLCFVADSMSVNTQWKNKDRTEMDGEALAKLAESMMCCKLPNYLKENKAAIDELLG